MSSLTGYLAAENQLKDLLHEISSDASLKIIKTLNDLVIVEGPERSLSWCQNRWSQMTSSEFNSVGEATKLLSAQQKFWNHYGNSNFRRGELIAEQLPKWKIKPLNFGDSMSKIPLGSFTLENEKTIWYSSKCSSPYPNGKIQFNEDKVSPPSRAYLKLWEFFTCHSALPKAGETCIDLGACPGGWTWVLAKTGAQVVSVDKAPLDEKLNKFKNIRYFSKDAFAIKAGDFAGLGIQKEKVDWLCSDIICYPPKLFELVTAWLATGLVRNFVITIKLKGETDFETIRKFKAIPNSQLCHLAHNKHELTWYLLENSNLKQI